jgi:hypothetical protein
MTLRSALSIFVAVLCQAVVVAHPGPPLKPGEQLKYRVSWAIVPGAGEIVVSAKNNPEASGEIDITTTTSTRGIARILLPFDATSDSYYDATTGHLMSLHERSHTRGKHAEHVVTFDYSSRRALYAEMGATKPRSLSMPEGSPDDLITALLETRSWNLKPGEARDALVLFNDDFYELTIHALRYEDVDTAMGTLHALVLQPRMEKTPPKGMFRKGSSVRVWISQDERRLPLRFEVEFNIGTGVATLDGYQAPTSAASSATADAENPRP